MAPWVTRGKTGPDASTEPDPFNRRRHGDTREARSARHWRDAEHRRQPRTAESSRGDTVTVRALVSRGVDTPPAVEDITLPDLGPGGVRVKVRAAGVCHSDL